MACVQLADEVRSAYSLQLLLNVSPFLRLVPEEELSLSQLLALGFGTTHVLQSVWVVACVPCLGANGHRSRCEVLHLFQLEVKSFGNDSQFGHIFFTTARVAADEVRDDLLTQMILVVDAVKDSFEFLEL